ncbi:hypothetical protein [Pyxidicoccus sp. MSG2]|uniref:hypothetical protein n=1 Tax=Pyxidicoccus sp. MSG2 TaxID=2996790 RepID=UPI002270B0D7|nr:hypothetical protein [Pyxidicoccus sp. MSG2]MCY1015712.1 hypothetical protein [Pyxidicoccus sp. MSG2]
MSNWFDDVMPQGEGEATVETVPAGARNPNRADDPRYYTVEPEPGAQGRRRAPTRPPPEDRGDFFSGNDVTADPFSAAQPAREPMDAHEPEPRGRRPGQRLPPRHPPERSPDEMRSFLSEEGPSLPALRERMGLPPLPEQGDFAGGDEAAEAFTEEAPQGDAGDGGFFTAENDPFEVPVMAGIEADPHQQRRNEMYDKLDKVAGDIAAVGTMVGTVNPAVGKGIAVAGAGLRVGNEIGRKVGAVIDDAYDRDDANRQRWHEQDLDRMKNQKAREKINKTTPRGHNKITED